MRTYLGSGVLLAAWKNVELHPAAEKYGLAALDALHIAAALRSGAEEFYTSEKPGKSMFRVKELKIISLHSL